LESFNNVKNIEIWRSLYEQGKNDLIYPNDVLVRIGSKHIDKTKHKRILDFGFGTGANLLHFAKQGFEMSGIEISEHAIKTTIDRLNSEGKRGDLKLARQDGIIDFPDNYFDIVIAWQVLCYNDWSSLTQTVKELVRVLRPGGKFIGATTAPGDITQLLSEPLDTGTYKSKVPSQEGCIVIIPEKSMLTDIFKDQQLDIGEFGYNYSGITSRHWIIIFEKENNLS